MSAPQEPARTPPAAPQPAVAGAEEGAARPEAPPSRFGAERTTAFVDAVVAIAMTLLILPLMEAAGELGTEEVTAGAWLGHHSQQLFSFVMSFALIAMFWVREHQMFRRVERVDTPLMWFTMGWLLSIVWLPVATALSGQAPTGDPIAKSVYIGGMALVGLMSALQRTWLLRHPELGSAYRDQVLHGLAADLAMVLLFGVALLIALTVPGVSYFPMFLMFLVGPAERLIRRALPGKPEHRP